MYRQECAGPLIFFKTFTRQEARAITKTRPMFKDDRGDEEGPDLVQASTMGCLVLVGAGFILLIYMMAILLFQFVGIELPNPYHWIR
jgi:hypothetical protein